MYHPRTKIQTNVDILTLVRDTASFNWELRPRSIKCTTVVSILKGVEQRGGGEGKKAYPIFT